MSLYSGEALNPSVLTAAHCSFRTEDGFNSDENVPTGINEVFMK